MDTKLTFAAAVSALVVALAGASRADEVTEWHEVLSRSAIMTNPATSPLVATRIGAIFSAAVFDAVNDGRYAPVHVPPGAPAGASRRAAAVQAAYASLLLSFPTAQYPSLLVALDAKRAASLAVIAADESASAVASGIAWGQSVAEAIVAWRSTDGIAPAPPPFLGGTAVGEWRPTPPAFLPGAGPQFATMTPWVIPSPSQFRPAGPPELTSARYASDLDETESMGRLTSSIRTADETVYSLFWNSTTPVYLWDRVAISLLERERGWVAEHRGRYGHGLARNARLLALLNLAMADAAIACWDAKYQFVFWRPITAIALADSDGNPATEPDPTWLPLFPTPPFPEYPSGHSTVSAAAATVLARFFGERTPFRMDSDLMLGVVRRFRSFSDALDEVRNARVYAGIHFRSACDDGQAVGIAVGRDVLARALPRLGDDEDEPHGMPR